jgi:glucokinase
VILAGDVGGTKTLLGLFERVGGRLSSVREASFPSREHRSLEAIVEKFLAQGRARVRRCAVGVAGPVVGGRSQVVNLRWPVDGRRLAARLSLEHARVLNDLEATAWGVAELPAGRSVSLTPGLRPRPGTAALIAAGTGLGMALLFRDGAQVHVRASEGGHQGFAPRDEREVELWRFLRARYGRVSVERVVAGPGISALYRFLVESGREESARMRRRLAEADDANAAITEAATAGDDSLAAEVLDWFVSLYGAAAGDLALAARATGGVWVGGGIAPRILDRLRSGEFVRAFRDKGRLSPFLERIPVRVILEPRTALLGAAAAAEGPAGRPQPRSKRRR